jgi:hypothetical protein
LAAVIEEDRLARIGPLDHVVREAGDDGTSEAGYGGRIARIEQHGNQGASQAGVGIVSP